MFKSFLSLWLKFPCPLCQRIAENTICQYCQNKISSEKLVRSQQSWQGDLPIFAWGKYDGEVKRAIAKLKYNNYPEIGFLLGRWLGESWIQNCPLKTQQKAIVLPIPIHRERLKKRGFNQAELIAKGFCRVTQYPLATQELIRIKNTQAMFGLNPLQRQNNIKNAFQVSQKWRKNPPQKPILAIDDIYTMGTTVKEVKRVLNRHRIEVAGAIAVAKVIK